MQYIFCLFVYVFCAPYRPHPIKNSSDLSRRSRAYQPNAFT